MDESYSSLLSKVSNEACSTTQVRPVSSASWTTTGLYYASNPTRVCIMRSSIGIWLPARRRLSTSSLTLRRYSSIFMFAFLRLRSSPLYSVILDCVWIPYNYLTAFHSSWAVLCPRTCEPTLSNIVLYNYPISSWSITTQPSKAGLICLLLPFVMKISGPGFIPST